MQIYKAGERIIYRDTYRGTPVELAATVVGLCNGTRLLYRIRPDRLDLYGNLTHFERSISPDFIVSAAAAESEQPHVCR